MNGIRSRQKPSGPSAASMNGRRRPSGVWNESLQGPITGDTHRAKTPSAPSTSADQRALVGELVEERRQVGRGRRDREREAEGAETQVPDEVRRHRTAIPSQTTSTTVRSARATSSSPSGSWPSTQPVRISSIPP